MPSYVSGPSSSGASERHRSRTGEFKKPPGPQKNLMDFFGSAEKRKASPTCEQRKKRKKKAAGTAGSASETEDEPIEVVDDGEPVPPNPLVISEVWGGMLQSELDEVGRPGTFLSDQHLLFFMRYLEKDPPNPESVCLRECQETSLQHVSGASGGFAPAAPNTVQPIHGVDQRHWVVAANVALEPVFVDPFNCYISAKFRQALVQLFGQKADEEQREFVVVRINCLKQVDGWSCGYRACAYAWYIANGDGYTELANLDFDSEELVVWLHKCLCDRKVTRPPSKPPAANAARIFGHQIAEWYRVHLVKNCFRKHKCQELTYTPEWRPSAVKEGGNGQK